MACRTCVRMRPHWCAFWVKAIVVTTCTQTTGSISRCPSVTPQIWSPACAAPVPYASPLVCLMVHLERLGPLPQIRQVKVVDVVACRTEPGGMACCEEVRSMLLMLKPARVWPDDSRQTNPESMYSRWVGISTTPPPQWVPVYVAADLIQYQSGLRDTRTCDDVWVCLQHQAGPALQQLSLRLKRHHLCSHDGCTAAQRQNVLHTRLGLTKHRDHAGDLVI